MQHANRKFKPRSANYRWIARLLPVLLVLSFAQIRNRAEETVVVQTNRHPIEAHPIYLIAVPPQEKMAPQPLNIPIVTARQALTKNDSSNDLKLPFPMSAAQAGRIGTGLIEDSDAQTALLYLEYARQQDASSLEILIGLARCYFELRRDDEALVLYKLAIARDPAVWAAQYYVGRIHLENGRYAQAAEALENAAKLKTEDTNTISSLGIALSKSGKSAEAINYLTRITALKRFIKEDFYYLGEAYANDKQWLKAAQAFKEGADLRGIDPNGYFYWATMLFHAGNLDEAVDGYGKARSVDHSVSHAGIFRYLAEIDRLRGMPDKALAHYQSFLQREPNDVDALFQAGYISFKLNQLDPAKEYFRKLTTVDPKHAGGAANLAALEARYNEISIGRNEKTPGITLREVVRANPNSVEAHVNLGAQLLTEGVSNEALSVLQQAVSLRPNSPAVQYDLGLAQLKEKKYEEAIISNKKALELKPDWPDAYNNLGLAYAGLGGWQEAVTAYREAIRFIPNYAGALYNLGIAYLRLGQTSATHDVIGTLRPLNHNLQARLWQEILATARATSIAELPAPTPATTPQTQTSSPETSPRDSDGKTEKESGSNSSAEEGCLSPIYRRSDVTQMAFMKEQLQVPYTAEAVQNKVDGKIVLQLVVCSNGRVSDIRSDELLPFGLTERAIEAIGKVRFEPALLGARPVSVMTKQTFVCAQQVCTLATASFGQGEAAKQSESPDFSSFPIVDFEAGEPTEPKVKAARNTKARKYSKKYGGQINEELHQIFTNSDWDLRLPALPVARSAAIFIGTVVGGEAHLSPDKTAVFSEFSYQIESILKSDPKRNVKIGETISVERSGGRVRMPSGKLVVSWTNNQSMPKVGSRYVFFLTHDFEIAGDTGNDFYLLTGYEFKNGKVLLLDSSSKQEVLAYKGASESSFLEALITSLKSH